MDETKPTKRKLDRPSWEVKDRAEKTEEAQVIKNLQADNRNLRESIRKMNERLNRLEKAAIFIVGME